MYLKLINLDSVCYSGEDFFFIQKTTKNTTFQPLNDEEIKVKHKNLTYLMGNSKLDNLRFINLNFDFENSVMTVNDKKFNIVPSYEYTYKKSRGNKILALNGINGIYDHIFESMNRKESPFYTHTFSFLEKIS